MFRSFKNGITLRFLCNTEWDNNFGYFFVILVYCHWKKGGVSGQGHSHIKVSW